MSADDNFGGRAASAANLRAGTTERAAPLLCGQRWLMRTRERDRMAARPLQRIYAVGTAAQPLDRRALAAALGHVVASHPALRMRLGRAADGSWGQLFVDEAGELTGLLAGLRIEGPPPEESGAHAQRVLAGDAATPLDLEAGPPLLARLVEMGGEHFLGVCVDRLSVDELGFDALEAELAEAYERELDGVAHLVRSPDAFLEYVGRELERRAREPASLAYWCDQLEGAPLDERGDADPDMGPGAARWVEGRRRQWAISEEHTAELLRACRARECSLFAAVLCAQLDVLRQLGSGDDLVVSVPVSNRVTPAERSWVANLSMLLHLRVRLPPRAVPAVRLAWVRDLILDGMLHRQYDYAALSERVAREAAGRGGHVSWRVGCSYVVERSRPPGDRLLRGRLDNPAGRGLLVPAGACSFAVRQREEGLSLCADWDSLRWRCGAEAMEQRFLEALAALTSVELG